MIGNSFGLEVQALVCKSFPLVSQNMRLPYDDPIEKNKCFSGSGMLKPDFAIFFARFFPQQ
jgi:hypothetical protein